MTFNATLTVRKGSSCGAGDVQRVETAGGLLFSALSNRTCQVVGLDRVRRGEA